MRSLSRRPLARAVRLAVAVGLLPAAVAIPCHLPEHLREAESSLTSAQLALLSHGSTGQEPIPYELEAATACVDGMADIYPCRDVDLLAFLPLSSIGGGSGNDMWGWVDPVTGREWALIGRSNGTAFVDVTDPENPVYVANLPTHAQVSAWRDIKVMGDHAYVVADFAGDHGLQVVDLTLLRTVVAPPVTLAEAGHYGGFERAHNVVIDELSGFAYAVGSDTCGGGLHMIDLSVPTAPSFAGCFAADGYTHDAQCVVYQGPDPDYQGRQICVASNEDTVTVVDVTDKSQPSQLSRNAYAGSGYTHQGWMTDDHRYFVQDDELDEVTFGHNTRTYVWDLSDLDQPTIVGTFTAAGASIDHNQYVRGEHSFQANYRRGLRILRLVDPSQGQMAEAAYFDTYPESDGNGFDGAWSVYPFLPSGIVLVSDINRGLFVLRPRLPFFRDGFESGDTSGWSATGL